VYCTTPCTVSVHRQIHEVCLLYRTLCVQVVPVPCGDRRAQYAYATFQDYRTPPLHSTVRYAHLGQAGSGMLPQHACSCRHCCTGPLRSVRLPAALF